MAPAAWAYVADAVDGTREHSLLDLVQVSESVFAAHTPSVHRAVTAQGFDWSSPWDRASLLSIHIGQVLEPDADDWRAFKAAVQQRSRRVAEPRRVRGLPPRRDK